MHNSVGGEHQAGANEMWASGIRGKRPPSFGPLSASLSASLHFFIWLNQPRHKSHEQTKKKKKKRELLQAVALSEENGPQKKMWLSTTKEGCIRTVARLSSFFSWLLAALSFALSPQLLWCRQISRLKISKSRYGATSPQQETSLLLLLRSLRLLKARKELRHHRSHHLAAAGAESLT